MELKPGYKLTDVGVFPNEWRVAPITAVTNAIFLGLTSTVDYVSSGGTPLIRATDIADGHLSFAVARTISLKQHRALTKYRRAKRGNVLVSKSGSLGVCAIVDVDFEFSIYESIIVLQPNQLLDSLFLLSLMRDEATQSRMIGEKVGSSVAHLNLEMFRKLVVPVPPISEQRAIAGALSDVDALIGALDQLLAKKRDLKQAAMQQLLTGHQRLPGFSGEWEVKKLGQISSSGSGGTPPSSVAVYYDGEIPWVSIADMTKAGKVILKTDRNLTRAGFVNSAAQMLPIGTVLYAMYASIGECSIAGIPLCSSQAILGIQPKGAMLSSEFLYYFLTFLKPVVKAMGQHGTQANLNSGIVRNFELRLPSLTEQTAIAEVLSDMDAELAALEQKRDKTRLLKQGMMQELLTGRTRLI